MADPAKTSLPLTVITTHTNADFDALASLMAAQKLYPEALVIFPGSQEKNLRNFFINSMAYLFNMADMADFDLSRVNRLVLVDTRQSNRIGNMAKLLENPDLEIHIYDHHPPTDNDISGHVEVHRVTGANVTILTEIIEERGIDLSADEATVMSLGLYEDTGSFTFSSTTPEDFRAAAFLLAKGANLNVVADLIARELSPEQIALLNDLIQAATRHHINGIEIVLGTITTENYMPDFAFLVQKMVKMENIDAIFAIARMENKIYVVARSRLEEVDAGAILSHLGGGGHPYAAAASVKGKTLAQTENELIQILYRTIKARRLAKHLMSSPAIAVKPDMSCREANDQLTRYNINALLIIDSGDRGDRLLGYITRQVIEKALFHQLDNIPVKEYMSSELVVAEPESGLEDIQNKIIENKQRILPVMDQNRVVGVITRTDLLNTLVSQAHSSREKPPDPFTEATHARTRSVVRFMKERLSKRLIEMLKDIGRVAEELDYGAYVVGGFVRDLFLYRADADVDIVIEGDGIDFARRYAKMAGARVNTHAKFGTAVIIFPDEFKIDVATARLEYYKFPAALPVVEMSSIKLDLYRRDFTINTLAIQLNPERFGILIDFFAAQRDIKEKIIRVLHNLSFVEDPTRVFRAIRFEQRFNFTIGKLTVGLIENAVSMDFFKRLSGRRVFGELRQILEEENPVAAIVRLHDFKLLDVIHPSIRFDNHLISRLKKTKEVLTWFDLLFLDESYMNWAIYFMVLIQNCSRGDTEQICQRFELVPRFRRMVGGERLAAQKCLKELERHLPASNSRLYETLAGFKLEHCLYMMAATPKQKVKKAISHFITQLRRVNISLTGKDLKKLGLRPGPAFRQTLQACLHAKLNGKLKTRNDEIRFAQRFIRDM